MRKRWRLLIGAVALAAVGVAGRMAFGPVHTLGPVGRCLAGGIDLNDPAPFTRARFGGSVVGLAASGGGSRAAYFEAAILREIRRAGSTLRLDLSSDREGSLLDQIDAISAVSGGALAASYFTLNAENLKHAEFDSDAWRAFLDKMAIEYRKRQWFRQAVLNPAVWVRSMFTDYNRGVLARDDYDAELFKGKSFHDLPDRPALYVNSFDVANHVRFVMSKHYVDTTYFQDRYWWGKLSAPQTLLSANDLSFTRIDPASVSLAEGAFASSAFPIAYPNLALKHCGSKILFQGQKIFLADGALADNSGLITLMTQLKAGFDAEARGSTVVVIYIDASVDRIDTDGSKFQQMGIEEQYAWSNTVAGHAIESIFGAVALLQDLGWKQIEGMEVVTDQLNMNWANDLTSRTGTCGPTAKASWNNLFASGGLAMRPLIIRLGLRDVIDPDFASTYGAGLAGRPELVPLLDDNAIVDGIGQLPRHLSRRLQSIPTDFTLAPSDRKLLDLAAFLLVQGKLSGDIAQWNEIHRSVKATPSTPTKCPG